MSLRAKSAHSTLYLDQIGLRKRLQLSLFFNNTLVHVQDVQAMAEQDPSAASQQLDDIAQRLYTTPGMAPRQMRDKRE